MLMAALTLVSAVAAVHQKKTSRRTLSQRPMDAVKIPSDSNVVPESEVVTVKTLLVP